MLKETQKQKTTETKTKTKPSLDMARVHARSASMDFFYAET